MERNRPTPEEIAPAEGVPMETIHTSVDEIIAADQDLWTDRQAVDHFGFIPEGVTVVHKNRNRFPAWRER